MRNVMLLVLGLAACRPAASAVRENAVDVSEVTVTDAERRRMEDSVATWIARAFHDWEQGDSARLMATYMPGDDPIVSAGDGQLYRSRDSMAAFLSDLDKITGKKAEFEKPIIDVLAPGIAAATYRIKFQGVNPDKKKFAREGVYSVVVAEREGGLHIVQEHQSLIPEKTKNFAK
jgi:hypothetical protein